MMLTQRKTFYRILLGLALTPLLSCKESTQPSATFFELHVSGDLVMTIDGDVAVFDVDSNTTTGTITWILTLSENAGGAVQGVDFFMPGFGPGEGTFPISSLASPTSVTPGELGAVLVVNGPSASSRFAGSSTSGSFAIASVTQDLIRGEFSFSASGRITSPDSKPRNMELTATGRFQAAAGDIIAP